jgi:NADPH-dependent glutamate synthase beta subunit-like oxidoreductase
MLLYSIPPYRLPKEVVRKQIQALRSMGIRFEVGVPVGNERTLAQIKSCSDAVFIAGGAWRSLKLGVPGENGQGVYYALDYLSRINTGETIPLGRKVIVIGGGSAALDAARTARRLGADEVHLVCLETRDPASKDRMPALDREIALAEEEGIIIHPSLGIRRIVLYGDRAAGIETKRCTSVREPDGRFNPQYDETTATAGLRGESVIVAIGQALDPSLSEPGLTLDPSNPETGVAGIFAGGDMTVGPSTVIQAVASAQKAVRAIEAFLGGEPPAGPGKIDYQETRFEDIPRAKVDELPAAERIRGIEVEDAPGLSLSQIETEARRCVACGCLAVGPSDLGVALVALDASVVTNRRTLPAQAFFSASAECSTVLGADPQAP